MIKTVTLIPTLALAIGLFATPLAMANDNDAGTISVTGIGTITAAPDMATINLTVLREAKTAREALSANNTAMADVLEAIKSFDIEDKDLQTSNFSINPRYIYPKASNGQQKPPQVVGYMVSNSLSVRIRDLTSVGDVLDKSVTLGVNQGGNIFFGNSNPEPLQMQARAQAMKNALEKAKVLTNAAGVEVGKIHQISEQGSVHRQKAQPMLRAMAMDASESVPIAGGENSYNISVNVTFEIDQ